MERGRPATAVKTTFVPARGSGAHDWLNAVAGTGARPMVSIYDILAATSQRYALDDVAVVLDAPRLGRQVFVGSRRPYGGELSDAEPGLYATGLSSTGLDATGLDPEGVDAVVAACTAAAAQLVPDDGPHRTDVVAWLTPIIERARRNQWPFTLAVMRADGDGSVALARHLRVTLRISDELAVSDDGLVAIALGGVRADDTVTVLHRVARAEAAGDGPCPRFAFGVVACPVEAEAAAAALELARSRLHDAIELDDDLGNDLGNDLDNDLDNDLEDGLDRLRH